MPVPLPVSTIGSSRSGAPLHPLSRAPALRPTSPLRAAPACARLDVECIRQSACHGSWTLVPGTVDVRRVTMHARADVEPMDVDPVTLSPAGSLVPLSSGAPGRYLAHDGRHAPPLAHVRSRGLSGVPVHPNLVPPGGAGPCGPPSVAGSPCPHGVPTTRRTHGDTFLETATGARGFGRLLVTSGVPVAAARPDPKVTICHRTNSIDNPYVRHHVDEDAVDGDLGERQGPG